METNLLTLTDSYKLTHYKQYPPKTEVVYSYFESRGGEYKETVFFGLQYFIKKYLTGVVVTQEKIDELKDLANKHFGGEQINVEGWEYILKEHGGQLPIRIKAVPEGTVVPTGNVLMTIENTDPKCFWLTNYLETLLVQVWYPTTVATHSREIKKMILESLERTGDPAGISFKLHDFGFRGVSSVESAGIGGCAHLVNFLGTDTFHALQIARDYYGSECAGFSIPASEHSTMTSWGEGNEVEAFRNMLTQYPAGLVACVSDSFDIYKACSDLWGTELKDMIMERDGTLVVRPDSGNPIDVNIRILEILGDKFGYTVNDKNYKVLDNHVRIIQGDGVDYTQIKQLLYWVNMKGWSTDNIGFGMGGALLQKLHRDTQKFAFKCSSITIDGVEQDVWKKPITDSGKDSKRGRLALIPELDGGFSTAPVGTCIGDQLRVVFENGEQQNICLLGQVRERAEVT